MRAEIISIGTELLLGQITDTNASYLASRLPALGIRLYHISQVGDNQERLVGALRQAWSRADLIVLTGGLGPTQDDLTREAIGALLGEEMVVQPELEHDLRASGDQGAAASDVAHRPPRLWKPPRLQVRKQTRQRCCIRYYRPSVATSTSIERSRNV